MTERDDYLMRRAIRQEQDSNMRARFERNQRSPYRDDEDIGSTPKQMHDLLKKFGDVPAKKPERGIHSQDHELAARIVKELEDKRPRAFGIWLGIIKRHGHWRVSVALASVLESKAKSPAKLLMWKLKQKHDGEGDKSNTR